MPLLIPFLKQELNSNAPLLLIFTGESNSGGRAANSDALPSEIGVRSGVQILNNNSLTFEDLDIGVNNLIGHYGLESIATTAHGFELELANMVDEGTLPNPTYLVKAGQGGTHIADWAGNGNYTGHEIYNILVDRVEAGISEVTSLTGFSPQVYMFYSQGLNDLNTPVETWKSETIAHFERMRGEFGDFGILMTQFNMVGYESINTAIQQICNSTPKVYPAYSSSAPLTDPLHWDYIGMKLISRRLINKLLQFF